MKFNKVFLIAFFLLGLAHSVSAKGYKIAKVYMFGFAASFNDSTVYFTDIQSLDVYIEDSRPHFLVNRDDYAYQMKNYLQNSNYSKHPTCVVMFVETEKKAMKKYIKMQTKYTTKAKGRYLVNSIDSAQFSFTTVAPDDNSAALEALEAKKAATGRKQKERKK